MNNICMKCDQCSYKTYEKLSLVQHVTNHFRFHDASDLVCFFCAKVFTRVATKKLHERIHIEPQGEFICETCGKVFKVQYKLDEHFKMTHLSGKFPCNECDQEFETKLYLKVHKETHKPIKQIACEVCGKLVRKNTLTYHLKFHRPREEKCSVEGCTKMFFTKAAVDHHITNCHEESKDKCPECDNVYSSRHKLRRHISRAHTAPTFFCEIEGCSYKQTRKEYLKKHLKHHKNIDEKVRGELLKKLEGRAKARFARGHKVTKKTKSALMHPKAPKSTESFE